MTEKIFFPMFLIYILGTFITLLICTTIEDTGGEADYYAIIAWPLYVIGLLIYAIKRGFKFIFKQIFH